MITMSEPAATRSTAGPSNRWLILVAMTGALSMVTLDQTVVTVALPSMSRDLPLTASGEQWVVNAYVLAMAALVAFGGKLGDVIGRVSTFRVGVVVFFVASAGCGLVPHGTAGQPLILTARAAQGAGAALMLPVSAAIVMAAFPPARQGRAMAVYAGISQLFLAIGPLLGGFLSEYASWRWVFWLNVPVGLAALVLVRIAAPPNPRAGGSRIRTTDVGLVALGIGLTVYAIQQASTWGWVSAPTLLTLVVGLALLVGFVLRARRHDDALIKVRLLGQRAFLGDNLVLALLQFALLGVILYMALYGQDLLGFSPVQSGLSAMPLIAALALAAQYGGRWFDRAGVRPPVLTGLVGCVIGLALWTAALPHLTYWGQVPGMVITGLGIGLTVSPTNTDGLARVDEADLAQGSGIMQTLRQLGGTVGVAIIGAVVLARYRHGTHVSGHSATIHDAADAVTAGFIVGVGAFAIALVVGWWLLGRDRPAVTDRVAAPIE
jgi:EmrB/QacA subfamily drug resistance transporter